MNFNDFKPWMIWLPLATICLLLIIGYGNGLCREEWTAWDKIVELIKFFVQAFKG